MFIALTTIGCKLNQSEITDLKQDLLNAGYIIVDKNKPHDLHIFNACSVTHGAEQITRQKIREIKRNNPDSQIFVMGCLNKSLPEINKFFSNKNKVLGYIIKNFPAETVILPARRSDSAGGRSLEGLAVEAARSRALIKIQSGCNFSCSYCIINKFRGKSNSIPLLKIIKQIQEKEQQGFKEIVLVGQNILQYKNQNKDITNLVKEILKQTQIPRIRFSSLDPRLIDDRILNLLKDSRICPHLHLSLQSGSNKILKLMNRCYTADNYFKKVKKAQAINPLTSITTDIIVGFPGETVQDFEDTLNFIRKIDFLKIHIFPYSARSGTKAATLDRQIDPKIKKERFQILNIIAQKQKEKFIAKMTGKELPVLFEHQRNNIGQGYTSNYIQVKKKSEQNLFNKIIKIKI